jgi:hypothetical protein
MPIWWRWRKRICGQIGEPKRPITFEEAKDGVLSSRNFASREREGSSIQLICAAYPRVNCCLRSVSEN